MTTRRLALAGLYGPLLFALLVVILTAIEWDFLHSINWSAGVFADPDAPWPGVISLGDWGWLQILNYLMLALSVLALAIAVGRTLEATPRIGAVLLVLVAIGFAGSAFKTDFDAARGAGPDTWNATLHIIAATAVFPAVVLAMLALAAQFRKDERWWTLSRPSLIAAVLALVTVLPSALGARNLFFYGFLLITLAWLAMVAARAASLSAVPAQRPT